MSKSVTVIRGEIWSQHSFSWSGNNGSGNSCGERGSPRNDHHRDRNRGDDWDTIEEGRGFIRRVRTN